MFQVNQRIQHIQHIQLWEQQVGECLEHSPWGSGLDAATWWLLWRPLVLSHSSSAIHPRGEVFFGFPEQQATSQTRPVNSQGVPLTGPPRRTRRREPPNPNYSLKSQVAIFALDFCHSQRKLCEWMYRGACMAGADQCSVAVVAAPGKQL